MKRLLFFITLVIVLISLNWFNELVAQDIENLTPQQKEALLKRYGSQVRANGDTPQYYETPSIYEAHESGQNADAVIDSGVDRSSVLAGGVGGERSGELPEFEDLVPFGMELFEGGGENGVPIDVPSASDYIIGPGDNLIIYLWGRVEKEYNLTLDREGKLFIPQVGELIGWGLTLEQFTERARKQFSRVYSDFDLTVSLGKIRSIRVFVAGEVKRPGAYTVSSLTSLFNALYLADGPNARGSMRQIRLMRDGKPVAEVDLYALLLRGDNSGDVRLQTGDVIFVPVAGPRVAVRGQVKRSATYELKGQERAADLLELAGGATAEAHLERVMLERISDDDQWEVVDINLKSDAEQPQENILLVDGDRMTVYSIFEAKKNIVAVYGQVKHTGYYERTDSTCVSDLIERAQLRPYDVYLDRADLFRRYPDRRMEVIPVDLGGIIAGDGASDMLLRDRDSLYVYSIDEVAWRKHVYIEGEVKNPGEYPLYDNMSVEDLVFLAGSYRRSALRHNIEIARIDSVGNVSIVYHDLSESNPAALRLREDDHVYVRQIPEWKLHRAVTIDGEVVYPGEYTLSKKGETLLQLIERVGGFTDRAFPRGTVVERTSINDGLARLQVPRIIEKSAPLREDSTGQIIRYNNVEYDGGSMSRLIIDMQRILASGGGEGDITLEPGDRIFVPTVPSGISVIGAVGSNGTIKYTQDKPVKYYVERAGNFTKQADKDETRLVRATGEVVSGGGILGKRVDIGDVIIVPTKIERDRNLLKTFTTALTAATGVLTSVYIISKL
ncbi:MAG: SLBB domain-containing protein [Candidatus Zixiibacteriota bacterium]